MSVQSIAAGLAEMFEGAPKPVHLHEPNFEGQEWTYVKDCLDTGWVSSVGAYVDRFEAELGAFCGGFAVPIVNGTAALHLALILAGVQRDDEVLVPALTFVATANAVSYCGAVPHFVDCHALNFGVDAQKLEAYLAQILTKEGINKQTGRKVAAMMVTHIFGHCADIEALQSVAQTYGIVLVEDAAESLGSYYKVKHTGTFGKVAALSFNGNKILTTGGGGAILTTDGELAARAKHLSTTAKRVDAYVHSHDAIGYNYRMPNINAALGCAQLEKLPVYLEKKKLLAQRYLDFFAAFDDVYFVKEPKDTISNHWLNSVVMQTEQDRNDLIDALAAQQVFCRGVWEIMPNLPMYRDCPSMDFSTARDLASRTVNLPSSPFLIDRIGGGL